MSKQFTVTFYSDPAHGWAKVKRSVLSNLKIADQVSSYSYQNGEYVFLEEDCDFPLLIAALEKHNTRIRCIPKHTNKQSRIRSYLAYSAQ